MLTRLKSLFSSSTPRANIRAMADSVCGLTAYESIKGNLARKGHGVVLRSGLVLTCLHVVGNSEIIYATDAGGRIAASAWKNNIYAYDVDLDLAVVAFDHARIGRPAKIGGDTEEYLNDMRGWLVTRFSGPATAHAIGYHAEFEEALNIPKEIAIRRTYLSDHDIQHGYSGSPIFDSRGRLSSLACALVLSDRNVQGPPPHRLAGFVQKVFDI